MVEGDMSAAATAEDFRRAQLRQEQAEWLRSGLLGQLAQRRQQLGLGKKELGLRIGRDRTTVQRAESEAGNVTLATFVEMAVALGMTPLLATDQGDGNPEVLRPAPGDFVHRGAHHNRTTHNPHDRDRQREAALAKAWEAANEHRPLGLSPVMEHLLPGCTQAQASAAATVVQWLGSEVGFDFLRRTLKAVGYDVVDERSRS